MSMTERLSKKARKRLNTIQLAESLGNVAEACRQMGMDRASFYKYRRRFRLSGPQGVEDLWPVHRTHPATTPPEVVRQIRKLSLQNPAWGCGRLSSHLKLRGVSVSGPTIQDLLIKEGLASIGKRLRQLEEMALDQVVELTPAQVAAIETANPSFRERQNESSRPGERLCHESFRLGESAGIGQAYLHVVVDTFSSYAFACLQQGKPSTNDLVDIVNLVFTPSKVWKVPDVTIFSGGNQARFGPDCPSSEILPRIFGLGHRRQPLCRRTINGFVERFIRSVRDEFLHPAIRERSFNTFSDLQSGLDKWVLEYNTNRPLPGYRIRGKTPQDVLEAYRQGVCKES